jgi:hypothetical protein
MHATAPLAAGFRQQIINSPREPPAALWNWPAPPAEPPSLERQTNLEDKGNRNRPPKPRKINPLSPTLLIVLSWTFLETAAGMKVQALG